MSSLIFEKNYRVHVYETGPNGKLSLHSLFNYLQDIASDHAETLGFGRDDLLRENRFWVLSRMYVELIRMPLWEDDLLIRTWPCGTESVFALRNYEIEGDKGTMVKASSSWLILDRQTRKIQRPDLIFRKFEFPVPSDPVRNATKLSDPGEQGQTDHCFRIKASDLDINLHTNNAVYLKWICDSYDLGFIMKNDPQSVEINYLAESKFGDEITIRTTAVNDEYHHSICRIYDKKELCRVKIAWRTV